MSNPDEVIHVDSPGRMRRVGSAIHRGVARVASRITSFFKKSSNSVKLSLTDPEPDTVISAIFGSGFGRLAVSAYFAIILAFAQLWIPAVIFFAWTCFEMWMLVNAVPLLAATLEWENAKRKLVYDYESAAGHAPIPV